MFESRPYSRRLAIPLAVIGTILVRLVVAFGMQTYRFDAADDHWEFGYEWGSIARWIVERGMFSLDGVAPTADTDPLYVYVVASFFAAFGVFSPASAIALVLFQTAVCAVTVWALFVLAQRVYGDFEARATSFMFVIYPASIFFAVGRVGPSSLTILLLASLFILVVDQVDRPRAGRALAAGAVIGLLVLTSSKIVSLLVIVPAWWIVMGSNRRRAMVASVAAFIVAAVVVITPWTIRNTQTLGSLSFSKTNVGYHLWAGNRPGARAFYGGTSLPEPIEGASTSAYALRALEWARSNPDDFARITATRISYFWYRIPRPEVGGKGTLHACSFLVLMALAIVGLFSAAGRNRRALLLWTYILVFPVVFYLTHVSFYRHRFHIEPFVLVAASCGLHLLWRRWAQRSAWTLREGAENLRAHGR